ncbi:FkbM family methyltransferase [Leptolyngbya sp. NIES-2104]|uniref:FkbM family methyltransferase n=1 Tax=Leptolyngbya sp. NIES-2104 TaxID=1552121 RepID=UPI0006EC575D|nr:FkbM family methyltransferase [Leptolyngbya sp. NIES-2104]GAP95131.1 methyltransferase, FkbM family domain protein [Leptolyngbya sp. NIES-2104]
MKLLGLLKPEYYYQPHKLLQRLQHRHLQTVDEWINVVLPWKMPIRVRAHEEHGRILTTLGVVDLPVTETLWRLTDPGECAVDVGANVGYMTALLAARVSGASTGKVYAFEAHPEIFSELEYNIQQWHDVQIEGCAIAVSNHLGKVTLAIDSAFATNRGLAAVISEKTVSDKSSQFSVKATTLDAHFSEVIHVLKVDVEGHELQVFQGAEQLLREKRIRDCVFEEHRAYPTPVTEFLEAHGYQIWRIDRQFWRPALVDPTTSVPRSNWLPTSFLATCDPERAQRRLQSTGWQCLTQERRQR